jgi:hypothetical protein
MKLKLILVSALCGMMTTVSYAQNSDFRGFKWGTALGEVETAEKAPLEQKVKDDVLKYRSQLAGADCEVYYTFNDNDKLISGRYLFTKEYPNPELYLNDYNKFKDLLLQKYGKPYKEVQNWSNPTVQREELTKGQAIVDGHLTLTDLWVTDRSIIKVSIVQGVNHPEIEIDYVSKTWNEMESQGQLHKALEML